jgi:hypothetical protein
MSLWALLKSPLLAGLDPSAAKKGDIAILTNPAVVAISQDALGVQGRMLSPRVLAAIPSPGDAAVIRPCNDSDAQAAPDSQRWQWGYPSSGSMGLRSVSSTEMPLCLTVGNVTDKDSHQPLMLIERCTQVGTTRTNQSFVYNESTRELVHSATGMCVSKSTANQARAARPMRPRASRRGTSRGDDWWTHVSDAGLHPYGNYGASFEIPGVPTVSAQVTVCSANCSASSTCYGWSLIKVDPRRLRLRALHHSIVNHYLPSHVSPH